MLLNSKIIQYILSAMIGTISPGMSNYSQVPVERCEAECQTAPRCENPQDFRCKPPKFNKSLYLRRQAELVAGGMTPELAIEAALPLAYSRPETYEEGLARYYIISESIVEIAQKNSYGVCLAENECKDKPTEHTGEGSLQACHLDCYSRSKWQRNWEDLAWSLAVISSMESGWRSDVQAGTGLRGRGDCAVWWKTDKINGTEVKRKVAAWTEGGSPDLSTCRSYGLTQIWFGNPPRVLESYTESSITYDKVLGLDKTSTKRAFDVAARYFYMAEKACRGREGITWIGTAFSLYGSGLNCDNKTGRSRESRFWKWSREAKELGDQHKQALESEEVQKLISYLRDATSPVLWLPAEIAREKKEETTEQLVSLVASN
jgi:hypothetical protein